jgi:hypothetical protein
MLIYLLAFTSQDQASYWNNAFGPATWSNWALAILATWAGYTALKMLRAIGRQTDIAIDTAERQLRAYVCIDSAVLKFPQPDVPEAQVHIKNCGQTPAYDVRGWIHTWFAEYPLKVSLPTPPSDFRMAVDTLAPGRNSIFVAHKKPPICPGLLPALGTPQLTFYVYGEVSYKDIFGKHWSTKYRLIYGGTEEQRKVSLKDGAEGWTLRPDTAGNEAT